MTCFSEVFAVPELFEQILLNLPGKTLIAAKTVCKTWYEAVCRLEQYQTPLHFWKRLCYRDIPWAVLSEMFEFNTSVDTEKAIKEVQKFIHQEALNEYQVSGLEETLRWLKIYQELGDCERKWIDTYKLWMWTDKLASCKWKFDVIDVTEKMEDYIIRNQGVLNETNGYIWKTMQITHSRYILVNCQEIGGVHGSVVCFDLLDNMVVSQCNANQYMRDVSNIHYVSTSSFYRDKRGVVTTCDTDIDDICDDDGLSPDLLFIADTYYPQVLGSCNDPSHNTHTYNLKKLHSAMNIIYHKVPQSPTYSVSALYCDTGNAGGMYNKPSEASSLMVLNGNNHNNEEVAQNNNFVALAARLYRQFKLPAAGCINVQSQTDRIVLTMIRPELDMDYEFYNAAHHEIYTWQVLKVDISCGHIFGNTLIIVTKNAMLYMYEVHFNMKGGEFVPYIHLEKPNKVLSIGDIDVRLNVENLIVFSVVVDISPDKGPVIVLSTNNCHLIKIMVAN